MKKKIISAVTAFIALICVLFTPGLFKDSERSFIILKNDELKELEETTAEEVDPLYVLNLSSKKYHKKDCIHVKGISNKNCYKTSNLEFIISRGYTKCSVCFKK